MLGVTAIGVGATVFFFNPSTQGFYPICVFHKLTGLNCPGCGMTRALYALLHGHLLTAMRDNALFVLTSAVFTVWGGRFAFLKMRNQPAKLNVTSKLLWSFLILAIAFAILRNLQEFKWLSP
ncbi:MAG: DUF2752 domain-containing protein [Limisphaerales bacterium]